MSTESESKNSDWQSLKSVYNSALAPFLFVGFAELLLIPAYYLGMKRYEQVIAEKDEEESSSETET